jgi:hypothetical protein
MPEELLSSAPLDELPAAYRRVLTGDSAGPPALRQTLRWDAAGHQRRLFLVVATVIAGMILVSLAMLFLFLRELELWVRLGFVAFELASGALVLTVLYWISERRERTHGLPREGLAVFDEALVIFEAGRVSLISRLQAIGLHRRGRWVQIDAGGMSWRIPARVGWFDLWKLLKNWLQETGPPPVVTPKQQER